MSTGISLTGRGAQVEKSLPSKHEAISSNPSDSKKNVNFLSLNFSYGFIHKIGMKSCDQCEDLNEKILSKMSIK
jgi:hypothetical protein